MAKNKEVAKKKTKNPKNGVRFHLDDDERARADRALAAFGGKKGTLAHTLLMERVDEINEALDKGLPLPGR